MAETEEPQRLGVGITPDPTSALEGLDRIKQALDAMGLPPLAPHQLRIAEMALTHRGPWIYHRRTGRLIPGDG